MMIPESARDGTAKREENGDSNIDCEGKGKRGKGGYGGDDRGKGKTDDVWYGQVRQRRRQR